MKTDEIKSEMTHSGSVRKNYWENIYNHKNLAEVGWYQARPETSLELIGSAGLSKASKIIDAGGGDSMLVDHLLREGYTNISVLDVSDKAIEKAKFRLGEKADLVTWICRDVTEFEPKEAYDLWHDRACFHFLTQKEEVEIYSKVVSRSLKSQGVLVLGTFSKTGPLKCSGLEIQQYDEKDLRQVFSGQFDPIDFVDYAHTTPTGSIQNYVFSRFKKM